MGRINPIVAWGKRTRKRFDAGRRAKAASQRSHAKAQARANARFNKYTAKQWKTEAKTQAKERARQRKIRERDEKEFKKIRRETILKRKVRNLNVSEAAKRRIYASGRRMQGIF